MTKSNETKGIFSLFLMILRRFLQVLRKVGPRSMASPGRLMKALYLDGTSDTLFNCSLQNKESKILCFLIRTHIKETPLQNDPSRSH